MTMHDSTDSVLDAMVQGRTTPPAPTEEECSKCGRKPADYSDFRGWDLNLATDQAFCPECATER
jgi:hypothetical protein